MFAAASAPLVLTLPTVRPKRTMLGNVVAMSIQVEKDRKKFRFTLAKRNSFKKFKAKNKDTTKSTASMPASVEAFAAAESADSLR